MSDTDPPASASSSSAPPAGQSGKPTGEPADQAAEMKAKAAEVFGDVKAGFETAKAKKEPYGLFAFASAVATLIWLCWFDGNRPAFWNLGLWSLFILASAALVFTPMVRGTFNLSETRAHQFATAGALGMAFSWIAFLLPDIQSNTSFFGTLATAFAGIAAWMAPGRPHPRGDDT
jgi:peptidoglycan/LPS O-acetylase OafA/YrhL